MTDILDRAETLTELRDRGAIDPAEREALDYAISLLKGERLLTSTEASHFLSVSVNTVKDLAEDGLLPGSWRLPGESGKWQIPSAAVRELIEDRKRIATRSARNPYALPVSLRSSDRLPADELSAAGSSRR
jgi:predicted DNA-binding transcriptional regulator AlpA